MALESYRRQRVISNSANSDFDQVIMLNTGDVDGRIVRFEAAKGNGRAATACKLWIDKGEGLAVFCELIRVDMPTPTWEAAIPVKGLDVGMYNAAIRLEDVDGSITETMPIRVQVVGSILAESEATEEMQDALDDFEIRTRAALADIAEAITEAETATTDAQTATTEATEAAQAANTAAQNIGASVDAQGILTVTDADGTTTTYSGAAMAAQSATSAAERATDAAVSAETAAGNIGAEVDSSGIVTVTDADGTQTTYDGLSDAVLLARGAAERADDAAINANAAKTAANSAALSANSAATSATSAAETATGAAETATNAATSANTAATAATSAANAANSAANSATSAASSANSAATSATNAATAATTATTNANTATTNANAATTAANAAAQSATDAATAANAAAGDATDAATEARDAAATALASAGNTVLGEMSMLDGSVETVDDAWPSPLRGIEVEGKSTQASVAGNQLALIDAANTTRPSWYSGGWDLTLNNSNGYTLTKTNTSGGAGGFVAHLKAGEYTISFDTDDISHAWYLSVVRNDNGTAVVDIGRSIGVPATTNVNETFTLTLEADYAIRPIITQKNGDSYNLNNIMLNSGSTALPWEPYVGGITSPNPDFPQAIHSVAEAGQVITGRCVWGGEKMADDIVAAIGNATYAYKGQDADGKYVALVGGMPMTSVPLFEAMKPAVYTYILRVKRGSLAAETTTSLNIGAAYTNGLSGGLTSPISLTGGQVYTIAAKTNASLYASAILGWYNGGITYIYYEQSGLFEGSLTTDDFVPYLGTTTPLIPSGVEPLRSLPNGVHDELIVHEDGSREIVRRVGKAAGFEASSTNNLSDGTTSFVAYGIHPADNSRLICNMAIQGGSNTGRIVHSGVAVYLRFRTSVIGSTNAAITEWVSSSGIYFCYELATPVIEPLPSLTMPSAPSSDVTAWLESKDESSAPIATDSSVSYERSMQIVIDRLEQAIADI